jgi:hypothetical protein
LKLAARRPRIDVDEEFGHESVLIAAETLRDRLRQGIGECVPLNLSESTAASIVGSDDCA